MSGSDAVSGMFAAMRDVWVEGMNAYRVMAEAALARGAEAVGRAAPGAADPLGAMLAPFAEMAGTMGSGAAGPGRVIEAAQEGWAAAATQAADLTPALAEACIVGAGSTFRYWRVLAQISTRHQSALMQAGLERVSGHADGAADPSLGLADDLRALLREIGEAAVLEARRLQMELAQIGEGMAQSVGGTAPAAERRHKVKE